MGYDIVIVARKPASDEPGYDKFESALMHLLNLHHLIEEKD